MSKRNMVWKGGLSVLLLSSLLFSLSSCAFGDGRLPSEDTFRESGGESAAAGDAANPSPAVSSAEAFGNTDVYVALGDSICRGYGLEDPEAQRYSTLIGEKTGATVYNYGVDGQTGAELIAYIRAGNTPELQHADVISISIGANNILHVVTTLFSSLFGSGQTQQLDLSSVLPALDEGIASFADEIPELIALIREQAPDATILFQTIYNPYKMFAHLTLLLDGKEYSVAAFTDRYVSRLNALIRTGAKENGYTVCDVYTAFEMSADDLVNASLSRLSMDPHPNAAGHALIAGVLLRELGAEKET